MKVFLFIVTLAHTSKVKYYNKWVFCKKEKRWLIPHKELEPSLKWMLTPEKQALRDKLKAQHDDRRISYWELKHGLVKVYGEGIDHGDIAHEWD